MVDFTPDEQPKIDFAPEAATPAQPPAPQAKIEFSPEQPGQQSSIFDQLAQARNLDHPGFEIAREAPELLNVLKDSAFSGIQKTAEELKYAVKGIHMTDTQSVYPLPGGGHVKVPDFARYVDKDGNPLDVDDVHSGKVAPEDVHSEHWADMFFPGYRGNPVPYFDSNHVNAGIAESIKENGVTPLATLKSEFYGGAAIMTDPQRTGFYKAMGVLGLPFQGLARGATQLLSNAGVIPPEDAKKMLSQEELFPHDLVDYFGLKHVNGATERFGLAATGFMADLFLDPFASMGTTQKITRYAGDAVEYGGRMITDLGQLSRLEKAHFNVTRDIEKIVMSDGKVISPEVSAGAESRNLGLLQQYKDAPFNGAPLNFKDLSAGLELSGGAKQAVQDAYDARMSTSLMTPLRELAAGDRQLIAKIPFTNVGMEIPFISDLARNMTAKSFDAVAALKNGMGDGLQSATRYLASKGALGEWARMMDASGSASSWAPDAMASPKGIIDHAMRAADGMADVVRAFATDTARPIFNAAARVFYNDKALMRAQAQQFRDTWYKMFLGADGKVNGEQLKQVFNLLDIEPQRSDEEIFAKFAKDGAPTDQEVQRLAQRRTQADQMRSNMTLEQLNLADTIKKQNLFWADKAIARGIPFHEINPLEEGNLTSGYIKHMLTKEYIAQYGGDSQKAAEAALNFIKEKMPSVDGSLMERELKIPVEQANKMAQELNGNNIKMFIEDPVVAHLQRIQDLQSQIRNHDLLYTLDDLAAYGRKGIRPEGYIEMNPDQWGGQRFFPTDKDGKEIKWYDQFLPAKMKEYLGESGNAIYLPEDVNTRLQYMMNQLSGVSKTSILGQAAQKMQYFFRNSTLFGTGYLGVRMLSHINTSLYSGTDIARLFDALKVITPHLGEEEPVFEFASGMKFTKSQLLEQLQKDGMFHTGFMSEDKWDQMIENIATSQKQRAAMSSRAMTVFDHAMGFSVNRALSEGIDDLGKIAHYMTKLDQGYSFKGAAESAEFWFYNYQMGPSRLPLNPKTFAAKAFNAVVPFSSTGIKTVEHTLQSLGEMRIAHLTLPDKVNAVLSGVYVGDPQERRFQSEIIPDYMKNSIHGPLLPGSTELMHEFPWVYHTMQALWNPMNSEKSDIGSLPLNPVLKLAMMGWAANHGREDFGNPMAFKNFMTTAASSYLPPLFKHAIAVYQLSHPESGDFFGIDFKDWYMPKAVFNPPKKDGSEKGLKFKDQKEFGEWVEHQYSDNALLNLWTGGQISRPSIDQTAADSAFSEAFNKREGAIAAGLGNYIRGHMRDLTFGLARATSLDVDYFSRVQAMTGEANQINQQMQKLTTQDAMRLGVPDVLTNPKMQERILNDGSPEMQDLVNKSKALHNKLSALHQYYGQVLSDEKNQTGIFRQIFGFEPNKVQYKKELDEQALDARGNAKKLNDQILSDDDFK